MTCHPGRVTTDRTGARNLSRKRDIQPGPMTAVMRAATSALAALLTTIALALAPSAADASEHKVEPRIVGGSQVGSIAEVPW